MHYEKVSEKDLQASTLAAVNEPTSLEVIIVPMERHANQWLAL